MVRGLASRVSLDSEVSKLTALTGMDGREDDVITIIAPLFLYLPRFTENHIRTHTTCHQVPTSDLEASRVISPEWSVSSATTRPTSHHAIFGRYGNSAVTNF